MRYLMILLFISVLTFGQDLNVQQYEYTIDSGDSVVTVDLYTAFGTVDEGNELKLIGFFTDATMTSTTLTFDIYDSVNESYKTLQAFEGGSDLSYTVAGGNFYPLDPRYFAGIDKLIMRFGTAEAADRSIVLVGRLF